MQNQSHDFSSLYSMLFVYSNCHYFFSEFPTFVYLPELTPQLKCTVHTVYCTVHCSAEWYILMGGATGHGGIYGAAQGGEID